MEQNDKQQQQRNHYTSYSLIGFSSIIILVITVFIFSSLFSSSSSQCLVERVGKMFNVEMDFRQRRANGRHESALSLSLSLKSFKVKRLSQLSLSLSLSFVQHVWASFSSTEHTPCIYRGQSEMREREKEMLSRQTGAPSTFYLWPVKKLQKSPFSLRCFSLSLSTSVFRLVRGRQIIRGGRANTKGVCGRVWF